jgi:hypothetical protein
MRASRDGDLVRQSPVAVARPVILCIVAPHTHSRLPCERCPTHAASLRACRSGSANDSIAVRARPGDNLAPTLTPLAALPEAGTAVSLLAGSVSRRASRGVDAGRAPERPPPLRAAVVAAYSSG